MFLVFVLVYLFFSELIIFFWFISVCIECSLEKVLIFIDSKCFCSGGILMLVDIEWFLVEE